MKLSFLPLVVLVGRVDMVSSQFCYGYGSECIEGHSISCCSGLECITETQGTLRCHLAPSGSPSSAPTEQLQEVQGKWKTITHDDFEHDLGNFERTKGSCSGQGDWRFCRVERTDNEDYIYKGMRALRLNHNGAVQHKRNHDLREFTDLRLRFWLALRDVEDNDKLVIRYSSNGGSDWKEVFQRKIDKHGIPLHEETIYLDTSNIDLNTTRGRIRVELDADQSNDRAYFDEVSLEGFTYDVSHLWKEITYDDFEDGWGSFTSVDDGDDADRVTHEDYVPEGNWSLLIKDDSGRDSSVFHYRWHDMTGCDRVRVSFKFTARQVKQGKDFVLQYADDDPSDWTTAKTYLNGNEEDTDEKFFFLNTDDGSGLYGDNILKKRIYSDTVVLKGGEDFHSLANKARIRFLASVNSDGRGKGKHGRIYIDDVNFECGWERGTNPWA